MFTVLKKVVPQILVDVKITKIDIQLEKTVFYNCKISSCKKSKKLLICKIKLRAWKIFGLHLHYFVFIVWGSALIKFIFLFEKQENDTEVAGEVFVFAVEIDDSFHVQPLQLSLIQLCPVHFSTWTGKCSQNKRQNTDEILRSTCVNTV